MMNTNVLMNDAENLTLNMALNEGPRDATDQIGIAQVNALLAIANETKQANDIITRDDVSRIVVALESIAASLDSMVMYKIEYGI